MPPVHLQMIMILELADPYPVLHLQLDKSTCQVGGGAQDKKIPRIFQEYVSDRASKLRFFKFLPSNENELSSSIVFSHFYKFELENISRFIFLKYKYLESKECNKLWNWNKF